MHEMNLFTILQTIQKLKAGVSVLIKNDHKLIEEAREMYLKNSRIYMDPKEEEEFGNKRFDFLKFLERDEKFSLKNCFQKAVKVDPI